MGGACHSQSFAKPDIIAPKGRRLDSINKGTIPFQVSFNELSLISQNAPAVYVVFSLLQMRKLRLSLLGQLKITVTKLLPNLSSLHINHTSLLINYLFVLNILSLS